MLLGCFFKRLHFIDDDGNVKEKVWIETFTPILEDEISAEKSLKTCLSKFKPNENDISLHLFECYREILPRKTKSE